MNEQPESETGLPPGITQEELDRHFARKDSFKEAALATLPGPLREAFAGEPRIVHGYTLQPVTAGLMALLERIKSPLLEIVKVLRTHMGEPKERQDAALNALPQFAPEAMIETVYLFVTPPAKVRQLLARGRATFTEAACSEIGDVISPVQHTDLERAIGVHFSLSFATMVQYGNPEKGQPVFP